ncbi:hypothetical protein SUGI_0963920 [Cryptomeria japonica]|nr:hypothetical protein SUGI_0963920 [Cryptomeria japonica]
MGSQTLTSGSNDYVSTLYTDFAASIFAFALITVESLKRNFVVLGMESLTDSEIQAMVQEGDLDGDEALNELEFCIMMVPLSPSFVAEADKWLQKYCLKLFFFISNIFLSRFHGIG